jgi:adenine phosphoribosyltransferase
MDLKQKIRIIPDFPKSGVLFKDITTLLKDGEAYAHTIDSLVELCRPLEPELIVGPEARGFVAGAPLAYALKAGFVPARKPGKLPSKVVSFEYELEYGTDALEIHEDSIKPGQRVLIADDLLATGGTAFSTIKLVEKLGGIVVGLIFVIELSYLDGRKMLDGYNVMSLIKY